MKAKCYHILRNSCLRGAWRLFCFIILFVLGCPLFWGELADAASVNVKKISVKGNYGDTLHIAEGRKIKLTTRVTVSPNKKKNREVRYVSSNKKVAKVSSKGYVQGVASGSCTVSAVSKVKKSKKGKIKVKVVKPVTGILFPGESGSLYVGDKLTLKATITPSSGTYKSLVWSSTDPGVATVNKSGKIQAVAAGTAIIKAVSVEGSKMSAKYQVDVLTADTVNIDSVEVLSPEIVRVTLDRARALTEKQFEVEGKRYEAGQFIRKLSVETVRNYDNKTYDLTIADNYSIDEDSFVQVTVADLPGNGTKVKTAQAIFIKRGTPAPLNWMFQAGEKINETVNLGEYATGNVTYRVTGLVDGLIPEQAGNALVFQGTIASPVSVADMVIEAEDEMGSIVSQLVHVHVGSGQVVVAAADESVTLLDGIEAKGLPYAFAGGGSGGYTFSAAGLPMGIYMDEDGTLTGTAVGTGEYQVSVTVTDKENNALSASIASVLKVRDPRKLVGTVTGKGGTVLTGAAVRCVNIENNAVFEAVTADDGTYQVFVEEGSYDIDVCAGDMDDRVYNIVISSGGRQLDFVLKKQRVSLP